jgi:hypothetical protein
MADDWTKTAVTLFEQIVVWEREASAILREIKDDLAALNARVDRLEKRLAEGRQSLPEGPEPPQ